MRDAVGHGSAAPIDPAGVKSESASACYRGIGVLAGEGVGQRTIGFLGTTNSKEPLMRTRAVKMAVGLLAPVFISTVGCIPPWR